MSLANMPLSELLILCAAISVSGLIAGVLAGLFGVGGGIIIVPVLSEVWQVLGVEPDLAMPLAVGTSLAGILPTAIRSTLGHDKKGAVDWPLLKAWVAPLFMGACAGVVLAALAGGQGLKIVFATGAIVLAGLMTFTRDGMQVMAAPPVRDWRGWSLASGNAALSTMMGIGGGAFGATILNLCGFPIHRAIGTAAGFGAVIAVPGTVGMAIAGWNAEGLPWGSLGFVSIPAVLLTVPAALISTPWGVRMAHALSRTALRRAFAIFLCLMAARMIWRAI